MAQLTGTKSLTFLHRPVKFLVCSPNFEIKECSTVYGIGE